MAWVTVLWGNCTGIRSFWCGLFSVGFGLVVCGFYFWGDFKAVFFGVWALFLIPPFLPCYIYVLEECFGEFSIVCFFPIALKEFLVNILYVSSGVVFLCV